MEAHEAQNKDVDPEVIQVVGLNKLDYSKIRVSDFCYLLNDRTDLTSNEYLKGVRPYEFQNVEMYDFIKFKTDNFDKYKFSLLIDDIRSFIPIFDAYFENDLVENVRVGFETSDGDLYSPEIKLHEFIRKVYVLRSGYFLHGSQFHLIRFSELAEELYQKIIDTSAPDTATIEPPPPEMDLSKLDDLFILKITEKQKARLKADIETFISTYKKKQIVALASILYDLLHVNIKRDHSFKSWLKMFCEIVGKEIPTAKENQVKEEIEAMKNTYYYLFPD